jgi:hypothetical protein
MDVVERRKGLAAALTAHDTSAVKSFLHPQFCIRGTDAVSVIGYAELLRQLPTFFKLHPEYRQSVEVRASKTQGDTATLTTRHIEVLRTWRRPHEVPSNWIETWKLLGDNWVLLEERPLVE